MEKPLPLLFLTILLIVPVLLFCEGFTCTQSDGQSIIIDWELPEFSLDTDAAQVSIETSTAAWTDEYGKPTLPLFSTMAGIPASGSCTLTWEVLEEETYPDMVPLPYQEDNAPIWYNPSVYESDTVYPAEPFVLNEPAIMRNRRVTSVCASPIQYDGSIHGLHIIRRARLTITFDHSRSSINELTRSLPASRAYESMFSSSLVNYEYLNQRDEFQQPCILFICYSSTVESYISNLVAWKHTMGYEVHTALMSDIGSTNTAIKSYIQTAYDTWDNPPEFVVLVGDATNTSYNVPTWTIDYYTNTEGDHPYTQLDGDDSLEDVCIGRLSFSSFTELLTIVAKIIQWEATPYTSSTGWYNTNLLVGDTDPSGVSCISTNKYVKEVMERYDNAHSYTEIYGTSPSATSMDSAINSGLLYFNYRGWIGCSGWTTSNIANLTNVNKIPVSIIITCDTGSFADGTSRTEAMLRKGSPSSVAGGVCAVGMSSSGTHTAYNNCLDVGIFEGLFVKNMRTIGEAVQNAKTYLWEVYGNNNATMAAIFCHLCNLMGDPSLQVWKTMPRSLSASYPSSVAIGTDQIVVQVTQNAQPLEEAWVTIYQTGDTVFETGWTDENGYIAFSLPSGASGTVNLTITHPGSLPILGSFTIGAQAASVSMNSITIDDDASGTSSGNGNGVVNPGEHIELKVQLLNNGTSALTSVAATLTAFDTDWVTISDASESWGTIASGASAWCTDDFDVIIDGSCPGNVTLPLLLSITSTQLTTTRIIELPVTGPALQLNQVVVIDNGSGVLDPGETALLQVSITNAGGLATTSLTGVISCSDSRLSFPVSTTTYGVIGAGQTVTPATSFQAHADISILPGSQVPILVTLYDSAEHTYEINFNLTIGTSTITDPVGPDSYGYAIYDSYDIAYDLVPVYSWVEIDPNYSGSGTSLSFTDTGENGDMVVSRTLPFTAKFYGQNYSTITICSNGWLCFGSTENFSFRNGRMPGPLGPVAQVAAFWDDLYRSTGNGYYYYDSANHRYIVEWSHMLNLYNSSEETFQIIIYDPAYLTTPTGDSDILIQYKVVNNVNQGSSTEPGCYCSVGIEDETGLRGLEYTFDNTYPTAAYPLANNLALLITTRQPDVLMPADAVIDDSPLSFSLLPEGTSSETLSLSNQGETPLVYSVVKQYLDRDQGGPDDFGYVWIDSNETGGPAFAWNSIQSVGTSIAFTGDDQMSSLINIGFSFPFYGNNYTQLRVCSNGFLSFTDTDTDWSNDPIPDTTAPNNVVAGFWDDLSPQNGGSVHYYSDATAGVFIVQFTDVDHYAGTYNGEYTFQMQLNSNGDIYYYYYDLTGDLNSVTIGIENSDGTDGLQIAYNETYIQSNMAIRIKAVTEWLEVSPESGTVEAGNATNLQLSIDSTDLDLGDYACNVLLTTNDPNQTLITIPVTLHVVSQLYPPAVPQNLRITISGSNAQLSWTAVTQDTAGNAITVDGYKIYRCLVGEELEASTATLYATTTATTFTDSISSSDGYRYLVTAYSGTREFSVGEATRQEQQQKR